MTMLGWSYRAGGAFGRQSIQMTEARKGRRYADRAIKASEFKAKCLAIMDEVHHRRTEVVITTRGKAIVRVVPADAPFESPIGFMQGTVVEEGDMVSPDHDAWMLTDES